jgi:hypothetical protein
MNILFFVLVLCAVMLTLVNLGLLVMWLKGIGSLFFPYLRFIVTIPITLILSGILQLAVIMIAAVVDRYRDSPTGLLIRSF